VGEAITVVDIPDVLTPPVRARVPDPSPGLTLDPDRGRPLVRNTTCAPVRVRGTEIEIMATTARAVRRMRTTGMLGLVSVPVPVPAPSVHPLVPLVLALAVAYSAFSTGASAAVPVAALDGVAPRVDTRLASLTLRANVGGVSVNTGTTSATGRSPVVLLDTGSRVKDRKCCFVFLTRESLLLTIPCVCFYAIPFLFFFLFSPRLLVILDIVHNIVATHMRPIDSADTVVLSECHPCIITHLPID